MGKRKDILVDDNNDLLIDSGDFVVGDSDMQHVDHIITAYPGEYKKNSVLGFGVMNYLKSTTTKTKFKRDLRVQLNFDEYENPNIDLEDGFKNLKVKV